MKYFTREELEEITTKLIENPTRDTLRELNNKYNGEEISKIEASVVEEPVIENAAISFNSPVEVLSVNKDMPDTFANIGGGGPVIEPTVNTMPTPNIYESFTVSTQNTVSREPLPINNVEIPIVNNNEMPSVEVPNMNNTINAGLNVNVAPTPELSVKEYPQTNSVEIPVFNGQPAVMEPSNPIETNLNQNMAPVMNNVETVPDTSQTIPSFTNYQTPQTSMPNFNIPSFEVPQQLEPSINPTMTQATDVPFNGNLWEVPNNGNVNNLMEPTQSFNGQTQSPSGMNDLQNIRIPIGNEPFFASYPTSNEPVIQNTGVNQGPTMFGEFERNYNNNLAA